MQSVKETTEEFLGAKLTCGELEDVGILDTPEYILYIDKDQIEVMFLDLYKVVIPEV